MMLAAMRERVPRLIKTLVCYIRGLIVEHNIDCVRGLSLQVTVMNQDNILMASTLDQARADERVEDFHTRSGTPRVTGQVTGRSQGQAAPAATLERVNAFYGQSHILNDATFEVREAGMP
jgi:ABC-type branched-subunit amino acid transport system ATPase component